jgi:hypothetical protein
MNALGPPFLWPLWRLILRPENPGTPRLTQVFTLLGAVLLIVVLIGVVFVRHRDLAVVQAMANPFIGVAMIETGLAILTANTGWTALDKRRWLVLSAVAALPAVILLVVASPFGVAATTALATLTVGVLALWHAAIAFALERGRIVT